METLDSPDVFKNTTPQPHPPGTARSSAGIRSNVREPTHARTHARMPLHMNTAEEGDREGEREYPALQGLLAISATWSLSLSQMNTPRSGAVFLTEPDLKPYNRPKTAPAGKGVVPPLTLPGYGDDNVPSPTPRLSSPLPISLPISLSPLYLFPSLGY